MAGAKETTLPLVAHAGVAGACRHGGGGAAEVRADAHRDKHLWADGALRVAGVLGLLVLARGRVGQRGVLLGQGGQHFGRAPHDPHGLAAPFHRLHATGRQVADIHLHTGAHDPCAFAGGQAGHQGHGDPCRRHAARGRCQQHQLPTLCGGIALGAWKGAIGCSGLERHGVLSEREVRLAVESGGGSAG